MTPAMTPAALLFLKVFVGYLVFMLCVGVLSLGLQDKADVEYTPSFVVAIRCVITALWIVGFFVFVI